MCKIKSIIFDLGGVMLQNKAESVYKKLAGALGIDFEELRVLQNKHKHNMLTGKTSAKDFVEIIRNNFKLKEDILEKWKKVYFEVMLINDELLDLVKKLKKKYQIAIISNVPELHAQINKERGLFSYFDFALISWDIGLIKPQEEIFKLALRKLDLKANQCIFIDDRKEHLDVPKKIGFRVILYKNNQQLIDELRELKIYF